MAAIRAIASAWVVQVMEVPLLLTSGSPAQINPPAHPVTTNFSPTHCAKPPLTQAFSPAMRQHQLHEHRNEAIYSPLHLELAVSVANFLFSAWASRPFCSVNDFAPPVAGATELDAAGGEGVGGRIAVAVAVGRGGA